jgi:hypothetical protein
MVPVEIVALFSQEKLSLFIEKNKAAESGCIKKGCPSGEGQP